MPEEISGETSVAVEYFSEENFEMGKKDPSTKVAQEVIKQSNPPSWTSRLFSLVSLQKIAEPVTQESNPTSSTSRLFSLDSLKKSMISCNDRFAPTKSFGIYLGTLPLKNIVQVEEFENLGITNVISVLEDCEFKSFLENCELKDGWRNVPVKYKYSKDAFIHVKNIHAPDSCSLTPEQIKEGAEGIHHAFQSGGYRVYLHCKERGDQSAMIAVAYLIQYQAYPLEKAIATVKESRPDINFNQDQLQAIKNCFPGVSVTAIEEGDVTEDSLAKLLDNLLSYVSNGVNYSVDEKMPEALQGWMPKVDIQTTKNRRDRYLRECRGNQEEAVKTCIDRNHGLVRRLKIIASGAIPIVGGSMTYSLSLWHQLREIALIAALYGHDINDPEVQKKILLCLIGGNAQKVPAQAVDLIARKVAKEMIKKITGSVISVGIPTHLIFNYLTDNSAKVSTHAIETFGGEHSRAIPAEDYL